jgi:hypothetical protein
MAVYFVSCFRNDHRGGSFPVREGDYQANLPDEALEVAHERVKSDKYDRVEIMAMGDPRELSTPILFNWVRDKAPPA